MMAATICGYEPSRRAAKSLPGKVFALGWTLAKSTPEVIGTDYAFQGSRCWLCPAPQSLNLLEEWSFMTWLKKPRPASRRRRGVLTLEWILLVTVIVIGIIGGLGVVRNATVGELRDLAEAITHLNVKTAAEIAAEGGGT
jgi:hypothetical protein